MLHNSLPRRDLLLSMNKEPLVLRRRDVHRNVAPRAGVAMPPGFVKLEGEWAVQSARDSAQAGLVAADAEDFLRRMGVTVQPDAPKQILFEIGSANAGFRCVVTP